MVPRCVGKCALACVRALARVRACTCPGLHACTLLCLATHGNRHSFAQVARECEQQRATSTAAPPHTGALGSAAHSPSGASPGARARLQLHPAAAWLPWTSQTSPSSSASCATEQHPWCARAKPSAACNPHTHAQSMYSCSYSCPTTSRPLHSCWQCAGVPHSTGGVPQHHSNHDALPPPAPTPQNEYLRKFKHEGNDPAFKDPVM